MTSIAPSRGLCVICAEPTRGVGKQRPRLCPLHRRLAPPEQLRLHLLGARAMGLDFDAAWSKCLLRVVWPHDTSHRREWKEVLGSQSQEWRSAYDRMAAARQREIPRGWDLLAAA